MRKAIYFLMLIVLCSSVLATNSTDLNSKIKHEWIISDASYTAGTNDYIDSVGNEDMDRADFVGGLTGIIDQAMNGSGKSVATIDDMGLALIATWKFWIYPNSGEAGSGDYVLYREGGAGTTGWWYVKHDSGSLTWAVLRTGTCAASMSAAIPTGQWTMVTLVRNTGDFFMYYNDTQVDTTTDASCNIAINDTVYNQSIGNNRAGGAATSFKGVIDELQIFEDNLNLGHIEYLYQNHSPCASQQYLFSEDVCGVPPNISMTLTYPTNATTYYGTYNGSVVVTLSDVNGSATCDINDTRFTLNTTSPFGNGTVVWQNNTVITQNNVSIFINCSDDSNTDNLTFWFYQANILELNFYDQATNTRLNSTNVTFDLISDAFAANYSTNTSFINISSLPLGDYTINYIAAGYDPSIYYLSIIAGQTNAANLYLINSTVSTLIIPTVYDEDSTLTSNVTMKIQRYYVATNSYITVGMTKTNEEGEGVLYAELYDVNYKIIFEFAGEIVDITDPYPFTSASPVYRINLEENAFESWVLFDNVISNVTFVNVTGTIYARYIFNDVTNNLREGCLKVMRYTTTDTEQICYNCTSSSSATLTCIVDHTIQGQYTATGSIDTDTENSWYNTAIEFFVVAGSGGYAFGDEGIFAAMIMVGTITMLGISTITGSFILLIVSFISVAVLGLIQGITIGTTMYLVVMVFVLLFIVRKVIEQ